MSLQNFVISTLMRLAQRTSAKLSAEHRFRRNRRFLAADRSKPGPAVQIKAEQLAGLPVEWVTPGSLAKPDTAPICLYLHGGAFVMGGLNSHRDLAAQLAQRAQIRLLMVDYRLAPEHPFPAALDDALAVYLRCWRRESRRSACCWAVTALAVTWRWARHRPSRPRACRCQPPCCCFRPGWI